MKNTVGNMKIIIRSISSRVMNGDEKAIKTLVDSYANLLSSIRENIDESFITEIEEQLDSLSKVKEVIDTKLIERSIIKGDYKQTHSFTLTTGRLTNVICMLNDLLHNKLYPKIQKHIIYLVSDEEKLSYIRDKYKKLNYHINIDNPYKFNIKNKTESILARVYDETWISCSGDTVYIDNSLKDTLSLKKIKARNIELIDVYSS